MKIELTNDEISFILHALLCEKEVREEQLNNHIDEQDIYEYEVMYSKITNYLRREYCKEVERITHTL